MINNIAIKDTNKDRIDAAITAAQGRARVRLLDYDSIADALEEVERRLSIPKAAMRGTRVRVDVNAQTFPSSYRAKCYNPESTWFEAVRTTGGWTLVNVWRGATAGSTSGFRVTLSDTARAAVIRRVMSW